MRRLIEHIISLPDELLPSLSIQDAAICHLCLIKGRVGIEGIPGAERIQSRIDQWLGTARPIPRWSEGRRTQTLLRELIERVQADAVDAMTRDELELMEAVYAFAVSAQYSESFEHIRQLVAPIRPRIAACLAKLPPVAGLPTLSKRYLIVLPEDVLRAPPRDIRVLAGVQLHARGPVLAHSGHVRVLGDVPDGTTLVVEHADCVVDGCVLGRVAVSGSCEIAENISGVVISRNGDIRAANAVDNSFVVAKRGRVYCRRLTGARLVFAGDALHVAENVSRSCLFSPSVIVDGVLNSGHVHASVSISAARFGADGAINLVLRRGLSCRDYGEDPGSAMNADVSRALRARGALRYSRAQMSLALRAAEQAAETCLGFLLAADETSRTAEEVIAAQRRLDVLSRIMLGLRALYSEAEAGDTDPSANVDSLERIDSEIAASLGETSENDPVRALYLDLSATRGQIGQHRVRNALLQATLGEIAEKLKRCRSEAERLRESIRLGLGKLSQPTSTRDVHGATTAANSKVLRLQRVLERARAEPHGSPLRTKADSAFTGSMSRTIEQRIAEAKRLRSETEDLRRKFEEAQSLVWNLYQMRVEDDDGLERAITIEGIFEGDVRMFVDPRLMARPDNVADLTAFIPSPSREERIRYICGGGRIREAAMTAELTEVGTELTMK